MVVKAIGVAMSIIGDSGNTSSVECVVLLCLFLADAVVLCGGGVACVTGTYVVERAGAGRYFKTARRSTGEVILSELRLF